MPKKHGKNKRKRKACQRAWQKEREKKRKACQVAWQKYENKR